MNMIEKIARAICVLLRRDPDFQGIQSPWDDKVPMPPNYKQWMNYSEEAKAAIEAMREPTKQMIKAGDEEIPDNMGYKNDAKGVYKAMIDKALDEGSEKAATDIIDYLVGDE